MNRRTLLAATPAVAALPALAALPAVVEAETPVMRLFREWRAALADLEREDGDKPSLEWKAVHARVIEIEERAAATAAKNAADVLMKAGIATEFGGLAWRRENEAQFWTEARALVGGGASPIKADQADTSIWTLYQQFQKISAAARQHPSTDDEELDRLFYNERDRVENALMAMPCITAQDMAIKMLVAHCHGDLTNLDYNRDPAWIEARLLAEALA